ncbi:site-2 protease family protein [Bremerella sp.]|uniref:site-2 protease family protein n=1 Tax=Bremerella sp. TaxID=2795602 RepID=UPI00391A1FA3
MFLTEPNQTQYDLHFSLFNIPVRVHPLFWLVALLMGFNGGDPKVVLLWVAAVFISILVHEMGHALVIQWYGWIPSVVLYSFGGLAIHNPNIQSNYGAGRAKRNQWTQIIISLAGPGAGFLLAGLIVAICWGTGLAQFEVMTFGQTMVPSNLDLIPGERLLAYPYIAVLINMMLYINIYWGLVNLLPIWPLDGGKISRELFQMADRGMAIRNSLILSIVCAVGVAILGFQNDQRFIAIFFAFMAIQNYQDISGPNRSGGNPW